MTCNALVISRYDFDKDGKHYDGYKLLLDLGNYGNAYCNLKSDDLIDIYSEISVDVSYEYGKWIVNKVIG